jgi:hypothetical protein
VAAEVMKTLAVSRDLIASSRGPANTTPIVTWPYPIDPWPGEPLPDEYDLLIYSKNGHRPGLLEHMCEVFPRHVVLHYGQYKREQLFEAARRSRVCAYLADDHGPLALQDVPGLTSGACQWWSASHRSTVHSGRRHRRLRRTPAARREVRPERRGRGDAGGTPKRNSSKSIPPSRSGALRSCNTIRTGVDCERHNPFTLAGSRAATEPGERI